MKKILFFLLGIFATVTNAQNLGFTPADTSRYGPLNGQFTCTDSLANNSSGGFYVDVIRIQNDTAPGWQTSFCLDVCYPPFIDSARVYIYANKKQVFHLDFYSGALPDTSTVLMKFKNVSNPSNVIYQRFYGVTTAVGIQENFAGRLSALVFPSPVVAGDPACFKVSGYDNDRNIVLKLYDLMGNECVVLHDLHMGNNYFTLDLPAGNYIYFLMKGTIRTAVGKIVLTR